jgi:hypothetical protein
MRVSLTKAQLRTELGAELLSLCQSTTADGRLATEEIEGLREWLTEAGAADLPAVSYLKEIVERILADGHITPEEYKELHKAVETVLPAELRKQASAARRDIEGAEKAAARSAKEADRDRARRERQRSRPVASANFMVAGARHEGRPTVIERHANAGDEVRLVRDHGNRFSSAAIAVNLMNGKQIGFVPDDEAQTLAPLLDQGLRVEAVITKILSGGRSPIPVVQVYVLHPDSTARIVRNAAPSSPEVLGARVGRAVGTGGRRILIGIGVLFLILFVIGLMTKN